MKCPCRECEKRGCGPYHDQCTAYSRFREWRNEVNRKIAEERQKKELSHDHEMRYRFNLKKGWNKP